MREKHAVLDSSSGQQLAVSGQRSAWNLKLKAKSSSPKA
jgi:hypothetical protein